MGDIWNIKGTLKNKMANERGQRAFSMGGITPSITTTTDFISINTNIKFNQLLRKLYKQIDNINFTSIY